MTDPAPTQVPLLTFVMPQGERRTLALDELQENTKGAANHLKGSMRCVGQLQPIIVEERPDGTYRIRAGHRRTASARALAWKEILAEVYTGLSEGEWALVLAGEHNRAPNPVEEARLYGRLSAHLTPEGISANTGVPVQVVNARLTLLKLPDDVLDAVGSKSLSLGVAHRAARLTGAYAHRAVIAIRQAVIKEEAFTSGHLKAITVARANTFGQKLMAAAPPLPTLMAPATVLALEVRELCQRRGIDLAALITELGHTPPPQAPTTPHPSAAQRTHLN
jgi:ParB family chromosome partitioning protein